MRKTLEALCGRRNEMLALTREWVETNSFTDNVKGVNRVGEQLKEGFALKSLVGEDWPGGKYGEHLIWRTPAAMAGKKPILLVGHHDTVFPPGHFEGWREEGGRAYGPGALDMKGGLAIIRTALAALDDAGVLADLPIVVVSVADEEVGSPSSAERLGELARGAACALVFESGRLEDGIVTRRRGTGVLSVTARGRAAHAGNAHREGINAIWALARFIDGAQGLTDYERGSTVNVGLVKGGTSKNTVPEEANCVVDVRFESQSAAKELIEGMRAEARRIEAAMGVSMQVEGGARRPPLERTPASLELLAEYAACQLSAGLRGGEAPIVGGGSDGNNIAALGVPVIDALGPRGAGFHTTSEYVELESFLPKAEALVRFLWGRRGR